MTSVDEAVKLVTQAVQQDSKANYVEAARCYREALVIFHQMQKSRSSSKRLQNLLKTKIVQYEERLKILDEYLLSKTDLTQFFKELESCHFDDCRSSISSETNQLYRNPLLTKSLNLIRRGRKEDEKMHYAAALVCYDSGLSSLLHLINNDSLSDRQAESARIKYLLYHDRAEDIRAFLENPNDNITSSKCYLSPDENLDPDFEGPIPKTETERMLQMEEVRSIGRSRHGSSVSLNLSTSLCHPSQYLSRDSLAETNVSSDSSHTNISIKDSCHSLYPQCDIKTSPSLLSLEDRASPIASVPLADLGKELSLSSASIFSTKNLSTSKDIKTVESDSVLPFHQIPIVRVNSMDDTFESELIKLDDACDDTKSQSSDSGYSGPSPDGTYSRDSKSPGSQDNIEERNSPLHEIVIVKKDDLNEKYADANELLPNVIVINELKQHSDSQQQIFRTYEKQNSVFQNPKKDILISQNSQENLVILDEDSVDGRRIKPISKACDLPVKYESDTVPDVYTPRVSGAKEYIPPRAVAQPKGEHGDMNKGCYYLMSALDFCWCL